eukprot:TRINITY_DN15533_c0_g2_i1.p1 TRINITY_DN15533_c0_g2~~TRINITY_DN15533_c0_g2_i1.p1  ORF type:complete len:186 (-),score=41.87 TRINITY_DN15533_c0_g2_i1:60-617(-)
MGRHYLLALLRAAVLQQLASSAGGPLFASGEESADCFTSESHFLHCCCAASQTCWAGLSEKAAADSKTRCCGHLYVHCPKTSQDFGHDDRQRRKQVADEQASSNVASSPKLTEKAKQAAVAASDAAAAIVSGQVTRAKRCSEMHVYSRKHCCDRRFEPPNSRCFESIEVFEACCQGGAAATAQDW